MKKTITTYCLWMFMMLLGLPSLYSKQIPLSEAEQIAKMVLKTNTITSSSRSLKEGKIANYYVQEQDGQVAYYAFNFQPTGFVIIAADDRYYPVLAFSDESHLDLDNPVTNIGLQGTLSKHVQRIDYIQKHNLPTALSIQKEWRQLRAGQPVSSSRSSNIVGPLTTTKWNQGEFYNGECPAGPQTVGVGPADRTYCGCTPIAMAQLIKYHNFPAQGNGIHQYEDLEFGTLTGDFCNTNYNWANMPDELTGPNNDLATLISHMGIASNTQYSVSYTETYFSYVRDAYVNYFGYDQAAKWFYDADYTGFAIAAKQDLDRGLPLLLTGTSKDLIGHTWVADGYGSFGESEDADYFHFNWGWGGMNNGWFLDSGESWDPLDGQEGGLQKIVYYWDRFVLYNLYPAESACQAPSSGIPANNNTNEHVYSRGEGSNYTYLYMPNSVLDQEKNYRYREAGSTDWIVTDVNNNRYEFLSGLNPGTQYEFQGRRRCCSQWSDYSTLQTFTTTGQRVGPEPPSNSCTPLSAGQLTTTSVSENFAYIYTAQPYGQVSNIFRYRAAGSASWNTLPRTTNYYQSLNNLASGTTYEFQVTHECSEGEWTGYSATQTFTTSGNVTCAAVFFADLDGDGFGDENNFISGCSAPAGYVNNSDDCDDTNASIPATPGSACSGGTIAADGCTCNSTSQGGCAPVSGSLTTTSISDHNAYVYTPQPNGAVNNQFRYRPVGSTNWELTDISSTYYRYLRGLSAGTQYEFQVSQACGDGTFSDFSNASFFSTTGESQGGGNTGTNGNNGNSNGNTGNNGNSGNSGNTGGDGQQQSGDCSSVSGDDLYVTSVSTSAGYVYTPQPNGATNNQFRYRPVGTTNWAETDISSTYYRYLRGLSASTTYEFQVRQECSTNVWSGYSDSYEFTTSSSFQPTGSATPMDYVTFRKVSTTKNALTIQVAPNPVVNELQLLLDQPMVSAATVRIYGIGGALVKEVQLQEAQNKATIEVAGLHSGIYLLEYGTASIRKTVKFIKR